MKIERIGLSLDSIAEERRRQHREHPDDESSFDDLAAGDAGPAPGATSPPASDPRHPPQAGAACDDGPRHDDPTARLRVDLAEEHPRRSRQRAIEAFTGYAPTEDHALAETDL
ncbi:MAG: hypothetical protein GX868_12425 [Actinobacteria bacterium]|nr:hypothetical protein [Actinomycetota bacterium]